MTLNEYQERANGTSHAVVIDGDTRIYPVLGLVGEAGEVANKLKKFYRDDNPDIEGLVSELGDVLWYVAELSRVIGYDLQTVASYNLNKLAERKAKGTIHGSGDKR